MKKVPAIIVIKYAFIKWQKSFLLYTRASSAREAGCLKSQIKTLYLCVFTTPLCIHVFHLMTECVRYFNVGVR